MGATGPGPTDEVVAHLRRICLAFPESTERPFGGHTAPAFRVRDKLFVHCHEDGSAFTCKAAAGTPCQPRFCTDQPDAQCSDVEICDCGSASSSGTVNRPSSRCDDSSSWSPSACSATLKDIVQLSRFALGIGP